MPPLESFLPFKTWSAAGNTEDDWKAPTDYFNHTTDFRHPLPVSSHFSHRVVPFQSEDRVALRIKHSGVNHFASETDLVIPKSVVSMWGPVRDGHREYSEVRVCMGFTQNGEEINLYNSIDVCVGAGMTNSQARVNLTKWRKRNPTLMGVRAKMEGRTTHQSPYCVCIEGVKSILETYQKKECLLYFFDGDKERLSPKTPPMTWPSAWWLDQMQQARHRRKERKTDVANESDG